MYKRKTVDEWQLWSNYGFGWEHETSDISRADGLNTLREYRTNAGHIGVFKLLKKRVKE
jgi:hypothetical protein